MQFKIQVKHLKEKNKYEKLFKTLGSILWNSIENPRLYFCPLKYVYDRNSSSKSKHYIIFIWGGGGGGGHLWLESWICNPKVVGLGLRSDRICWWGEWITSALFHTQYHDWGETLEQGTEPPGVTAIWLPTDGLNAEHNFSSMGHHTWPLVTSLSFTDSCQTAIYWNKRSWVYKKSSDIWKSSMNN